MQDKNFNDAGRIREAVDKAIRAGEEVNAAQIFADELGMKVPTEPDPDASDEEKAEYVAVTMLLELAVQGRIAVQAITN